MEVIDEAIEPVILDAEADLVGISTLTLDVCHAYELADQFRSRGIPVLMGGMHPTAMPEEALHHADAVVIGEAEGVFDRILSDFKEGRMRGHIRAKSFPILINCQDLVMTFFVQSTEASSTRFKPHGAVLTIVNSAP